MTEKPLHVQVAEALGWTDCLFPESGILGRGWVGWRDGMELGTRQEIPRYDTDWSATGPLIEKYRLALIPYQQGYSAEIRDPYTPAKDTRWTGSLKEHTPLLAVCHLLLALKQEGKL